MATITDFGIDFSGIGPAVGEPFPDVMLPDQHGNMTSLHQARGGRRALVVFHRSASW
jgi:peroxiredoxin